jgi:hypothetical protein
VFRYDRSCEGFGYRPMTGIGDDVGPVRYKRILQETVEEQVAQ